MVAMASWVSRAGAAVPGEVLGAGGHARALQAGHCRGGVPRHQRGVRAERPGADHRAVRRAEHVGARREVDVDPERGQVGADRPVDRLGQRDVVHRAERGVARVRAAVRVRHPGDVAALLVDRDHRVAPAAAGAASRSARWLPGAEMFWPNRVTPARPRPSASSIQPGADNPGKGGMRIASARRPSPGPPP